MSEKTIAQKLLLKPGRKILILKAPAGYVENIGELPPFARIIETPEEADVIQLFIKDMSEFLSEFPKTAALVPPSAVFWVTFPKKTSHLRSDLDRDTLHITARLLGWEGVALFAVDDNWSAMRFKTK